MKLLVTGGLGFIGSNFVRYILNKYPNYELINLDKVTYCGRFENLQDLQYNPRYAFVKGDIGNQELVEHIINHHKPDVVVNIAAESHNDNAIKDPHIFVKTNVLGTQVLLHACLDKVKRFHHVSTCEVYGDLDLYSDEKFTESTRYAPKSPYNASKAGSDHIVMAYYHTFGLPITISNAGNNYGPYQYPEKLIPLFVTNAIENKKLPLFKSSQNKREWIHVLDHCKAIDAIIHKGKVGQYYNVGTGVEKSIEEITKIILTHLQKPESLKEYVPDRKSHDRRYLLDSSKIMNEIGWTPEIDFDEGIKETINWYKENEWWWRPLKDA